MLETNTKKLPDWYTDKQNSIVVEGRTRRHRGSPVRRALQSMGTSLARELCDFERRESWMYDLEPRAKILGALILIFGATLLSGIPALLLLFLCLIGLTRSSKISASSLGRIWLGVPLFSLAIVLPAITNLVTAGPSVLTICHFGAGARFGPWLFPKSVSITQSGIIVASRFLLRSIDCVTAAYILLATTKQSELLNGFRRLGLPKAFGMILTMMHRYLALILRAASEIHLAKLSRTISSDSLKREQKWVGAGIGILFRKTYRLSQEVYAAMTSRGFDGDLRVSRTASLGRMDFMWLAGTAIAMISLILIDRMF